MSNRIYTICSSFLFYEKHPVIGRLHSESIGNEQVLVADAEDGRSLPGETGPLRLIVPGDKRPARWVRMVKTIRVITNPTQMFHVEKAIRMAWEPIDCPKLVIDTEATLDSCVERATQYLTQISQQTH